MNNKGLYLAWLRTVAPTLYAQAIRKATGQSRSLGGLTDNLVQQALAPSLRHSFLGDDTTSMDTTFMDFGTAPITTGVDTSPIVNDPIVFQSPTFDPTSITPATLVTDPTTGQLVSSAPTTVPAVTPSNAPNIFTSILQSVASIGSTVVSASQQSSLIALNTQRAAQGLPPVNANGQVVTAAGVAATNPALLAFENAVSGGSGSMLPILLIGGAIGLLFLFSRPARA